MLSFKSTQTKYSPYCMCNSCVDIFFYFWSIKVVCTLLLPSGSENTERKDEGWIIMLKFHLKRNQLKVWKYTSENYVVTSWHQSFFQEWSFWKSLLLVKRGYLSGKKEALIYIQASCTNKWQPWLRYIHVHVGCKNNLHYKGCLTALICSKDA